MTRTYYWKMFAPDGTFAICEQAKGRNAAKRMRKLQMERTGYIAVSKLKSREGNSII